MVEVKEIDVPVLLPEGAECVQCVERLRHALATMEGVRAAEVDTARSRLRVTYDPAELSIERLEQTARAIGVSLQERFRHENLPLEGLDCPDCATTVERAVARLPGVLGVSVNFLTSTMHIEYEERQVSHQLIVQAVRATGYQVPEEEMPPAPLPWWRRRAREAATAACGVLLAAGFLASRLGAAPYLAAGWYALAIVVGGRTIARGAWAALAVRALDMNVLMTIAVLGAASLGDWGEGALVVFLFSVGNVLEGQALARSRESIRALISAAPAEAIVIREGREETVPVDQLEPGAVIAIKPGQAIPVDGVVSGGSSTVNQAPITGEAVPVGKGPGDPVFAGSLNELGFLEVRVTKRATDSSLARIIEMVESAQTRKARTQRLMDRFARGYTPVVIVVAAAIAVMPPLLIGAPFRDSLYRGLTILLLGCPCSLVISTPVTIVTAISSAARHGVLIKGGTFLEEVGSTRVVALDKTGTLTYGRPEVTDVITVRGCEPRYLLAVASSLESKSAHPLAAAVVRHARQAGVRAPAAADFQVHPGKGVSGRLEGRRAYVGNPAYLAELGIDLGPMLESLPALERAGKTYLLVAEEGSLIGLLAVADTVREGTKETVQCLKAYGVQYVLMLTGDSQQAARALAERLGVDDFRAQLLPEDKLAAVEALRAQYGRVVMVGDGVNDAPALAAANVGVAMGAVGSDTALETADVALMSDDLTRLPYLLRLGRTTLRVIKQNIALSLFFKLALLLLAFPGWLTLWLAVIGDVGVSLVVIGNGLRLLAVRPMVGLRGEPCLLP